MKAVLVKIRSPLEQAEDTTWLRCALDFEIFTGIGMRAIDGTRLTWSQRANTLASVVRAIARTNILTLGGERMKVERMFPSVSEAGELRHLGIPPTHGMKITLSYADSRTADVVAVNAVKAKAAWEGQRARARRFGDTWTTSTRLAPTRKLYEPLAMKTIRRRIAAIHEEVASIRRAREPNQRQQHDSDGRGQGIVISENSENNATMTVVCVKTEKRDTRSGEARTKSVRGPSSALPSCKRGRGSTASVSKIMEDYNDWMAPRAIDVDTFNQAELPCDVPLPTVTRAWKMGNAPSSGLQNDPVFNSPAAPDSEVRTTATTSSGASSSSQRVPSDFHNADTANGQKNIADHLNHVNCGATEAIPEDTAHASTDLVCTKQARREIRKANSQLAVGDAIVVYSASHKGWFLGRVRSLGHNVEAIYRVPLHGSFRKFLDLKSTLLRKSVHVEQTA